MALSPDHFERVLCDWATYCLGMPGLSDSLEAVAMDGKTLCGTLQPHKRAVHLLSLLDQKTGCVSQVSRSYFMILSIERHRSPRRGERR